jgi:hypothetical protein
MKRKQIISLLLTLLMLFSSLPIPAYAEWYDEKTGNEAYSDTVVSVSDAIVIPDWDNYSGDDASDSENDSTWEEWDDYADFSGEESDETEDDSFWYDEDQPDEWETGEEPENEEPSLDSPVLSLSLKETIDLYGYAYVLTKGETKVYDHPNRTGEPFFLLTEEDAILLATEYRDQSTESVEVWFLGDELFTGYVSPHSLKDAVLTDEEVDAYTDLYWWDWADTEAGTLYAFAVAGYATITSENDAWNNEWGSETNADDEPDFADAALSPDPDQSAADECDELTEDEEVQDEAAEESISPVLRSSVRGASLNAVQSASTLTGNEDVRLGKESSNINGILLQNNGSQSNSIARHWVTVNGTEYTAFCIQVSKSATSGRDGNLESSTDAGLQWIMINVSDSSDQDYAIKQQAIWIYLGQSYSASDLKAGSRCTLSTDELRARLNSIVASANSASFNSRYEL